jgi:hypothetical protein
MGDNLMPEITIVCPCGCEHEFEIDIDDYVDIFEVARDKLDR